jgi:ribonucleotide reductase class II
MKRGFAMSGLSNDGSDNNESTKRQKVKGSEQLANAPPLKSTYREEKEVTLPTHYQQYIHAAKYARWVEAEGRRETWQETVNRYVGFFTEHVADNTDSTLTSEEQGEIRDAILHLRCMPSMRALMTAGKALKRDNMAGYNCAYVAVNRKEVFSEIMYVLMCGTGVGFSVERQEITNLPVIPLLLQKSKTVIHIRDSKIGWASGMNQLIAILYSGSIPKWDITDIRAQGERLKTFGGRASGSKCLVELFKFIIAKFKHAVGRKLNSLENHDIVCKIAEIVICGSVRRSALLSLSNLSDERMRVAKSGQWYLLEGQRALANNSVCYTEKPDVGVFLKEWLSLYDSKSGERGVFNREAMTNHVKRTCPLRNATGYAFGTNPCIPDDTWILTDKGSKQVKDLVNTPFVAIVDGEQYESKTGFVKTGHKPVYRLTTHEGYEVRATDNHKIMTADNEWVELKDMEIGDKIRIMDHSNVDHEFDTTSDDFAKGWLLGSLYGDGTFHYPTNMAKLEYWGDDRHEMQAIANNYLQQLNMITTRSNGGTESKYADVGKISIQNVALFRLAADYIHRGKVLTSNIESESLECQAGFLRGWFDADGSPQGTKSKGFSVRLSSTGLDALKSAQRIATRIGIYSTLYQERKPAGDRMMPDGKGGLKSYFCKAMHELIVSRSSMKVFSDHIGFHQPHKAEKLEEILGSYTRRLYGSKYTAEIVSIKLDEICDVYDATVEDIHAFDANGLYVHNCSEIILRDRGLCNLSEVVIRKNDTPGTIMDKARIATIIGTLQSTLTNFRFVSPQWKFNSDEERLLGVSLTGVMDNEFMCKPSPELKAFLPKLRDYCVEVNKEWAERLGINQSVSITCIKPSGTVSQLVDCASGIHARHSQYYERTVRGSDIDPLTEFAKAQGVPSEPSAMGGSNTVFSFPIHSPEGCITRNDMSAIEQLEIVALYGEYWATHKISCTISVRENEWVSVAGYVYDRFDSIGGVSFLPNSGSDTIYKQAPYQDKTKDEYEALLGKSPTKLDWSKLSDFEKGIDTIESTHTLACTGGACEIR